MKFTKNKKYDNELNGEEFECIFEDTFCDKPCDCYECIYMAENKKIRNFRWSYTNFRRYPSDIKPYAEARDKYGDWRITRANYVLTLQMQVVYPLNDELIWSDTDIFESFVTKKEMIRRLNEYEETISSEGIYFDPLTVIKKYNGKEL